MRETERGITVTLPENLWLNSREMNFAQTADAKIANLASVLANNPDDGVIIYRLIIESHTDDKGSASELQSLTDERARLLSGKLNYYGIKQSHIEARGMGATVPVASNATPANRAKNRRTEIRSSWIIRRGKRLNNTLKQAKKTLINFSQRLFCASQNGL